jgi:hypothetical protein
MESTQSNLASLIQTSGLNEEKIYVKELIAHSTQKALQSSMNSEQIASVIEGLMGWDNKLPGSAQILSFAFYFRIYVTITNGKKYTGDAGGLGTGGAGFLWGDIYYNDLNVLYNQTASFMTGSVGPYFFVHFFSDDSKLTGTFQSGGVADTIFVGGGTGHWS